MTFSTWTCRIVRRQPILGKKLATSLVRTAILCILIPTHKFCQKKKSHTPIYYGGYTDHQHFLLSDVARILMLKPHQIVYSLSTRQVPEPTLRVANKRIFLTEDVERLAQHFHVSPQ